MNDENGRGNPPIPDDFFNDGGEWSEPDIDNRIWGESTFDDFDERIFDEVANLPEDVGFDPIEAEFSDDDEFEFDDLIGWGDDLTPFSWRYYEWAFDIYGDEDPFDDDLGDEHEIQRTFELPLRVMDSSLRGPFPTLDDLYGYFDIFNGRRLILEIFYVFEEEAYYATTGSA